MKVILATTLALLQLVNLGTGFPQAPPAPAAYAPAPPQPPPSAYAPAYAPAPAPSGYQAAGYGNSGSGNEYQNSNYQQQQEASKLNAVMSGQSSGSSKGLSLLGKPLLGSYSNQGSNQYVAQLQAEQAAQSGSAGANSGYGYQNQGGAYQAYSG